AVDRDRGCGLVDGDGDVTAVGLVVAVAGGAKAPVGGAAGNVAEAGTQVEQAAQVFTLNAAGRAAGAVGVAVVDTAVAVDGDGGCGLVGVDGDGAAVGLVVAVAGGAKAPVGGAAGNVAEVGTQVEQAAEVLTLNAAGRAVGAVRGAVVDTAVAVDRDR